MAANEETVSIDTVKKTLWDSLEAIGENISGETLTALMEIIEGGGSSSNAPLEINCTSSVDSQTGKQTITTELTAAELFEAVNAGRCVRAIISVPIDDQTTISITKIILVDGQVLGDDDETVYEFSYSTTDPSDGLIGFSASDLSAGDTVVFRQL